MLISSQTVLIVGGDVSGWLLDLNTWEVQTTDNGPAISRSFATIQKMNGKFYVLGGDAAPSMQLDIIYGPIPKDAPNNLLNRIQSQPRF